MACIQLQLADDQKANLVSNVETIAESKFEEHHQLRAIYVDEQLVGLLAYAHETDPPDKSLFWIFRLMVDKHHQRRGIGSTAMRLALQEIEAVDASRVRTMHKPANSAAANLYRKIGFRNIGLLDDGDKIQILSTKSKSP